jgi:hypothetical protein
MVMGPTWSTVVGGYEAGIVVATPEGGVGYAAAYVGHVGRHTLDHKPAANTHSAPSAC